MHGITDRLAHGAGDDTEAGKKEVQADDAQRANADRQHFFRRFEDPDQNMRNPHKQGKADEHDGNRGYDRKLISLFHAVQTGRTVVVGDDRDHAVV